MIRNCETCTAFSAGEKKNADGSVGGDCRARAPIILTTWFTPNGSGWNGGFPPTNSLSWCREYEPKLGSIPATGRVQ